MLYVLWPLEQPPVYYNESFLYCSAIMMAMAAAIASKCRYYEMAAIVMGLVSMASNYVVIYTSLATMNYAGFIINGAAAFYFFWQMVHGDDEFRYFHLILGVFQLLTIGSTYWWYLSGAFPDADNYSFHYWFAFVQNRLFDLQIILILFCSRMKLHGKLPADSRL